MKKWIIDSLDELERRVNYSFDGNDELELGVKQYYANTIEIPKKKHGTRTIYVVDKTVKMYKVQKDLKKNFLDYILLSDKAFGFVKNQDYFSYLQEHVWTTKTAFYLRIDIKDFFESIGEKQTREAFSSYVGEEEKKFLIDYLQKLILYKGHLVQGTPVAPIVSNIVFRPVDVRIAKYCNKRHVNYSRYADDLLFSTDKANVLNYKFVRTIERILDDNGFCINYDKLRMTKDAISLNGFVVDRSVRLSRKKIKSITGIIFYLEAHPFKDDATWMDEFREFVKDRGLGRIKDKADIVLYLAGQRAFLIRSIKASNDEKYVYRAQRIIKRIEKQIDLLSL